MTCHNQIHQNENIWNNLSKYNCIFIASGYNFEFLCKTLTRADIQTRTIVSLNHNYKFDVNMDNPYIILVPYKSVLIILRIDFTRINYMFLNWTYIQNT